MPISDIFVLSLYAFFTLILSVYSAHAFLMLYLYRKNRAHLKKTTRSISVWPYVTVQLPIYNEQYVVQRLIDSVCALDYPRDKFEIQILDDSTDETQAIVKQLIADYQAKGIDINYIHRDNRQGYKAGALRAGLEVAKGEFLAIFDADFVPLPDFLKKMIPYFSSDEIGLVQARWGHLNAEYSLLTRSQSIGLDAHFVLEHGARNASGIFINFNGTAGIWRKSAIIDAGNWNDDTLTEDIDISYRAQLAGWKFVYVNDVVCPAEVPAEVYGFKNQQYRWAKGAIQTAKKLLPTIWRNKTISRLVKFEATIHLTNHFVFPLILLLALLLYPVLMIKNASYSTRGFFLIMSIFAINAFSYPIFYIYAQREIYPDWKRRSLFFPIVIIGFIGLSVVNTRAVISGLLGRKSTFTRTPKFNLSDTKRETWHGKLYRSRFHGTIVLEIILFIYVSLMLCLAITTFQYIVIPLLVVYWLGFTFISTLSVCHAFKR